MANRFYALTPFIAPDFSLLVPDWTFGAAMDRYRAANHSYAGPLYVLFTPDDVLVLVNRRPGEAPDAIEPVCRKPHGGRIDHAPAAGALRPARRHEALAGLRHLARQRGEPLERLLPPDGVWVAGTTGFCIHQAPHRLTVFGLRGGESSVLIHGDDRDRIASVPDA